MAVEFEIEGSLLDNLAKLHLLHESKAATLAGLDKIGMTPVQFKLLVDTAKETGSYESAAMKLNIDPAMLAAFMALMVQLAPLFSSLLGIK